MQLRLLPPTLVGRDSGNWVPRYAGGRTIAMQKTVFEPIFGDSYAGDRIALDLDGIDLLREVCSSFQPLTHLIVLLLIKGRQLSRQSPASLG